MSYENQSEGSKALDQREHNDDANAKRVILRGQNPDDGEFYNIAAVDNGDGTFSLSTSGGGGAAGANKLSDEYGITAISEDATYKYFWFEADDARYYIMRKHKTTKVFTFTKGTGGYAAVYVDENSGPSGSPTWGTRGATF